MVTTKSTSRRTTAKPAKPVNTAAVNAEAAALLVQARSGVPAATATSASAWKRSSQGTLLVVPSGATVRVQIKGMEAFLRNGVIPNSLMGLVTDAMEQGKKDVSQDEVKALLSDPGKLQGIIELADAVCVDVVLEPKVLPPPRDGDGNIIPVNDPRRDENTAYTDEIEFDDKMYIFNFVVGGTADLAAFRTQ